MPWTPHVFFFWNSPFHSQHRWLYFTSHPCPWIKSLSANTTRHIPKCWERSVKTKSNLSFVRAVENSSFDQHFLYVIVKAFLKVIWWWFLVLRSEHILSSGTLLCKKHNILTLSMLIFSEKFLALVCSVH